MKIGSPNRTRILLCLTLFAFIPTLLNAQCEILGLDSSYCINDDAVVLTGSPGGGTFSGPGMTGSTFDPADAGVGIHTIEYTIDAAEDKYYIKSVIGSPWGSTSNNTAMDNAFGPGGWILSSFEAAVPATVFSPSTSFVFLEGSDAHAIELNTFLVANLALIEAWVAAGGSLLLNAAPNEGGDINFGFAGTTLDYPVYAGTVTGVDPLHPAFVGPMTPTTTAMTGPFYSHGRILGVGYTNVVVGDGNVILAEKPWGAGTVMVGGMTTANWHSPAPHGTNFRANLLTYLNSLAVTTSCIVTQDVEVFDIPTVIATVDAIEICEGETVVFTGAGADDFVWDLGVINGDPFSPIDIGTTMYTVSGTDLITGCENTDSVAVTLNPLPTLTLTADATDLCLGDMVTFSVTGADDYTWDTPGITEGIPYEPLATGIFTYTVTGTNTTTGCQNTASIDITVNNLPTVIAAASESIICLGETVTFNGGGADSYVWDVIGVTDGIAFSPATVGTTTYTVTGTVGASGCENTASVDVTVNDVPTVTASASEIEICEGESIILTGGGASTYSWDIPGMIDGVAFIPAGLGLITATVTGTDGAGCSNSAAVSFTINETPSVTGSVSESEVCYGNSVTLTGAGADSYTWSPAATNGVPFTPGTLGSFTYTVNGTTAAGCSSTSTVSFDVIDCEPVVAHIDFDDNICAGACITLNDESTGPVITWDWDFGGAVSPATSTESNPEICFTTVGTYTITLQVASALGAISSTSKTISVNEIPTVTSEKDTIIEIGGSANLIATSASTGNYTWTPDDYIACDNCANTVANPQESVRYTVHFIDENGCSAEDTVLVLVNFKTGVGVPSAFSPNGDGNNDVLFVKGYGIEALSFTIYNRYGEVVFYTTDQSIGWDGTFKDRDENPGVFTWSLQYNFVDGKAGSKKGNTTLIR